LLLSLAVFLLSYLVGAIPFGYLIARGMRGIDIREHGSGNIGATNVGRVLGWPFFVLVFVLDFAKGAGPVLAGWSLMTTAEGIPPPVWTGLGAILGHMWPVYLGFRGGKGVATSAGVITFLAPWPALAALGVWILCMLATRYVSLSSMAAAVGLCIARIVETWPDGFSWGNWPVTVFCFAGAALVILRHRSNIGRLLRGTEPKVGRKTT
jgi:glycerol-3-phosphate acyltransferase PlsY